MPINRFKTSGSLNAAAISKALAGRRSGRGYTARCPAHDDHEPSLSIADGENGVLVYCHAGCDQADVIASLHAMNLWPRSADGYAPRSAPTGPPVRLVTDDEEAKKRRAALRLWDEAKPIVGTVVETYLHSRKLVLPTTADLRFHPGLRHPSGGTWPGMVALITRGIDAKPVGIHRTFLARDGLSKAPVKPQKMMLGSCAGGVVRLAAPADVLMVGEGIETCIAAMILLGHPAWAALSTSGLRALQLSADLRDVMFLADADQAGEAAARECAYRWKQEGRRVRIARPPQGTDFNDVVVRRGA